MMLATTMAAPDQRMRQRSSSRWSRKGISPLALAGFLSFMEGGSRVASSFVASGLADEIWLLRGPQTIGSDGIPALDALPLSVLTASPAFKTRASESLGEDTLTVYERA